MTRTLLLPALAVSLALVTGLPASGFAQPAPSSKAMAPGIDGVQPLAVIEDRYLFGPLLARGANGRLHMQFYRGEDHMWKGRATVGYAFSDDDGRSWIEAPDAVASADPKIYDRFGSFGRARTGKLVTLFSRRMAQDGQKPILFQTVSIDEGRSWQAPRAARVAAGDHAPMKAGWFFPYGPIRMTPAGVLVVMTYAAEDNFVLVSRDNGENWTRYLVISSARPNYSEMGLEILDENTWLAVSRIDGPRNRMAQFITRDSGRSWALEGGVNLPEESNVNVAPMIDDVTIGGRKVLLLSYCDRRPKKCWLRFGAPGQVADDPQKWGGSLLFDQGFSGRSGYQSLISSRDGKGLVGAIVRERTPMKAVIVVFRIANLEKLGIGIPSVIGQRHSP